MLPLIRILQEHLFQKETTLTHPIVCSVRNEIKLSFGSRWNEPALEGYFAAILDPRFKDLSFELEKFEQTKSELKHRMKNVQNLHPPSFCETNSPLSLLSSLFENSSKPI
ncbi:11805_t:CDS:1, partial [Gigaspora rosea]